MNKLIYTFVRKIMHLFPRRDIILLESKPILADNTYAVYRKLIQKKYNKKYKIIWILNPESMADFPSVIESLPENVEIFIVQNFLDKIYRLYLDECAKLIISCNSMEYGIRKGHRNIYLGHGVGIKNTGNKMVLNKYMDLVVIESKFFLKAGVDAYQVDRSIIKALGYARSDYLYSISNKAKEIKKKFSDYKKIIIWMPTFRISERGKRIEEKKKMLYSIPIISTTDELNTINKKLGEVNCLLLIKYHFAQDVEARATSSLSNIKFIDNNFFYDFGLQVYEFLSVVDALITDYSTVYFEYLMTNKPIGLAIDDLDEYQNGRGLVFKNYYDNMPGNYINNISELEDFIDLVCDDMIPVIRNKITDRYNDYYDGKTADRIVDYLQKNFDL